jgi:uncharacterized protein YcsI (UPF0317 family)
MKYSSDELKSMKPKEFRALVRKGAWNDVSLEVCQGFSQANMVILPREYAFEFLLFCNRNPQPCPVLDVTEPGEVHPESIAPDADIRTDLPGYRVYENGEIIDEPTDIVKYWKDDLVGFMLGCSRSFVWAMRAANLSWREYGPYPTTIPCKSAGRFHGHMVVTPRAFFDAKSAVRAVQISSRHIYMHGAPVFTGAPGEIGIKNLGQYDAFFPKRPVKEPPKPGETLLYWGCGITPQIAAMESKIPFMITHKPAHMFVSDLMSEELAIL